jgi:hypothetical protein
MQRDQDSGAYLESVHAAYLIASYLPLSLAFPANYYGFQCNSVMIRPAYHFISSVDADVLRAKTFHA